MSSSDPAGADRIYHFISDPDHKENLSGRVRAACMNCRRKKIKCSGETNCRTCQERGLICEGPPERKRPTRSLDVLNTKDAGKPRQDSSSSNQTNHSPTTASSRQQSIGSSSSTTDRRRSSSQRPTAALLSQNSHDSSDSGYFSPRLETIPSSHPDPSYTGVGKFPTRATVRSEWAFQKAPTSAASYSPIDPTQAGLDQGDPSPTAAPQGQSNKWTATDAQNMWWPKQSNSAQTAAPVYSDLMSTASLLEEQALSLRQLAFHQVSEQYEDMSQDSDLNMLFPGGESQMSGNYQQQQHGWWQENNNNDMNSTNPAMQFRSVSYSQSPLQAMAPSPETWQRASMQVQQQQQQQQRQQYNNSASPQLNARQSRPGGSARQQSTPNPGSMTMFSWAA